MSGLFSLTSTDWSSYLSDLFSSFPPLVLRCVPHCSSWLKPPQPFLSSLCVSVSFCNLAPWVRSLNVLFFLSSEAALQWKVLGYISVSSQLFQFWDFYGYRDLSCPTFHLTFGKSRPWATFPSHRPACVYSHLILPSMTSSCSSSVSYESTSPPHHLCLKKWLLTASDWNHSHVRVTSSPSLATNNHFMVCSFFFLFYIFDISVFTVILKG